MYNVHNFYIDYYHQKMIFFIFRTL